MTRDEAIAKIAEADGPEGRLFQNWQWGAALVDSLAVLGLLKFEEPNALTPLARALDEAVASYGDSQTRARIVVLSLERAGFKIVRTE